MFRFPMTFSKYFFFLSLLLTQTILVLSSFRTRNLIIRFADYFFYTVTELFFWIAYVSKYLSGLLVCLSLQLKDIFVEVLDDLF
jgi:hypothetical protein